MCACAAWLLMFPLPPTRTTQSLGLWVNIRIPSSTREADSATIFKRSEGSKAAVRSDDVGLLLSEPYKFAFRKPVRSRLFQQWQCILRNLVFLPRYNLRRGGLLLMTLSNLKRHQRTHIWTCPTPLNHPPLTAWGVLIAASSAENDETHAMSENTAEQTALGSGHLSGQVLSGQTAPLAATENISILRGPWCKETGMCPLA